MKTSLLATWEVTARTDFTSVIVPDGCRDLIMYSSADNRPAWFVTPLFDRSRSVSLISGTTMTGFRLRPGTAIEREKLFASLSNKCFEPDDILDRLDVYTACKDSVEEALFSLASEVKSVASAAKKLGITPRTLQRLVTRETGRSPVYWIMLARARKAARALNGSLGLVEIADVYGYSDQAHMNREFKHWFNTSPAVLRKRPDLLTQLDNKGYDGADTGVHSSIKKPFSSET